MATETEHQRLTPYRQAQLDRAHIYLDRAIDYLTTGDVDGAVYEIVSAKGNIRGDRNSKS